MTFKTFCFTFVWTLPSILFTVEISHSTVCSLCNRHIFLHSISQIFCTIFYCFPHPVASSSRRGNGQHISVDRLLSDSKARFLSGSLCCSWYRCSWWPHELIPVVLFSPPAWLSPWPWPSSRPWLPPLSHRDTGGTVLCKDLPGIGIEFSGSHITLANILKAKEWSAHMSGALPQFPVEDLPWQAIRFHISAPSHVTEYACIYYAHW